MAVPNTFASATSSIPLANLDANFAYYDAGFSLSGSAVTFAGSITLTTGTANGVPYLNASKVLTSGAVLTFDGTTLSSTKFAGALNGTVGATTPTTGAFTTLTTSSTVTLSGGTANGVAYLNGSKVLTTGSALTFDGTNLGLSGTGSRFINLGSTSTNGQSVALQISAPNSDASASVYRIGSGLTEDNELVFYDVTSTQTVDKYIRGASGFRALFVNGSEQMRLTSTGLGIGTSSPSSKLDVLGTGDMSGTFRTTGASSAASLILRSGSGTTSGQFAYVRFINDDTTGQDWRVGTYGTNNLSFYNSTAGATRMVLDTSGNLGIGTSSPSAKLSVNGGSLPTASSGYSLSLSSALAATRLTTDASSHTNFIGSYYDDTAIEISQGVSSGYVSGIVIGARNATSATVSDAVAIYTRSTERARIDSSGNLLVGTTATLTGFSGARGTFKAPSSATSGIVAQSQAAAYEAGGFWNTDTTGNNTFVIFGTEATYTTRGSITYNRAGGLTVFNTTSDYRAKDILGPVQNPGAMIDALKVYEGRMKGATQSRPMLVAHEAQAVTPYAVTGEKDAVNKDGTPKHQQMDVSALVPLLLAELQSLRARVAQLESKP